MHLFHTDPGTATFLRFLSDVDGDDDNIFATNFLKVLSYLLLDTWYTKKERVDNNALHER
jgi:hypothetical protein